MGREKACDILGTKREWDEELRDIFFKKKLLHFHGKPGSRVEEIGPFEGILHQGSLSSALGSSQGPVETGPLPPHTVSFKSIPPPTSCPRHKQPL